MHLHGLTWILAAGAALAVGPAGAAPAVYALDPAHTFVHFGVLHFGTSTLWGRFGPLQGAVEFDPVARTGRVGLTIPLASLQTGWSILDRRVLAADLLGAEQEPNAYYVASRFEFDGDRLQEVRGEFTLRGVSQPLTLRAERFGCRADTERGGEVCGGDFRATVLRSSVGASFGLPLVGDEVQLIIQVEGWRPAAP